MRLLLLGNSHCAAVMRALAEDPRRWPGLELGVMALPGNAPRHLRIEGDRFVSSQDGVRAMLRRFHGSESPSFVRPDAVVVLLGSTLRGAAALSRLHRSADLPSTAPLLAAAADGPLPLHRGERLQLHSRPAFALALAGLWRDSSPAIALRMVAVLGVPVAVAPVPLPPEAVLDHAPDDPVTLAMGRGDAEVLLDLSQRARGDALRSIAAETGADLRLVRQPAQTIVRGVLTGAAWTQGSARLFRAEAPDDPLDGHANAAYGALLVEALRAALG